VDEFFGVCRGLGQWSGHHNVRREVLMMMHLPEFIKQSLTREEDNVKHCGEWKISCPIKGQCRASPGLVDRRRRLAELHAFEVHVPLKK
jgi:hypothetical protein